MSSRSAECHYTLGHEDFDMWKPGEQREEETKGEKLTVVVCVPFCFSLILHAQEFQCEDPRL